MGAKRARIPRSVGTFAPSSSPIKVKDTPPPRPAKRGRSLHEDEYIDIFDIDDRSEHDDDDVREVKKDKKGKGKATEPVQDEEEGSESESEDGGEKRGRNSNGGEYSSSEESSSEEEGIAIVSDLIDDAEASSELDGSNDYHPGLGNGPPHVPGQGGRGGGRLILDCIFFHCHPFVPKTAMKICAVGKYTMINDH